VLETLATVLETLALDAYPETTAPARALSICLLLLMVA
jgi:hypothetical protein